VNWNGVEDCGGVLCPGMLCPDFEIWSVVICFDLTSRIGLRWFDLS